MGWQWSRKRRPTGMWMGWVGTLSKVLNPGSPSRDAVRYPAYLGDNTKNESMKCSVADP
jgi:hypothetical protein